MHGDVVRIDGGLQSHVCSFKVVFPGKEIFLRKSVLDEWQTVVDFTGVKIGTPMREGMEHFIEQEVELEKDEIIEKEKKKEEG